MLKGIVLTVNYPDDSVEAAIPSELTLDDLLKAIAKLYYTEPDMTSFQLVAVKA